MTSIKIIFSVLLLFFFLSCSKDKDGNLEKDLIKPTITLNYDGGFPKSCSKLKRGQQFTVKVKISDNVGLASYAIDIHNNFDHHTHDSQDSKCNLNPMKNATENTFKFLENYTIQNTPKEYEIIQQILIPANTDIGDYHCHIDVTDVTGWSKNTSVDIKIIN